MEVDTKDEKWGGMLTLRFIAGRLQVLEYQNCAVPGGVRAALGIGAGVWTNRCAMRCGWTGGAVLGVFGVGTLRRGLLRGSNGHAAGMRGYSDRKGN